MPSEEVSEWRMETVGRRIYLDHNASAPLLPQAREALIRSLDLVGNPSSVHSEGRRARALVEEARRNVARLVRGSAENVVFTASATEAAATCLTPDWIRDGDELRLAGLAVVDADHPATREGGRFENDSVTRLGVDAAGIMDFGALDRWLASLGERPAMLAICLANGETGVVQPIDAIRERLVGRDIVLVVDAVQAVGRLMVDMEMLGADALLVSGHKLGAAKGIGAFVLASDRLRPVRLIPGGGQEKGVRSGTEAVPLIASFGAAAVVADERAGTQTERLSILRDSIVADLRSAGCEFTMVGEKSSRLPNTLSFAIAGRKAESLQIALDLAGFAVSAGSACSSGKVGASPALAAMVRGGLDVDAGLGLIRVSLGWETTQEEIGGFSVKLADLLLPGQTAKAGKQAA